MNKAARVSALSESVTPVNKATPASIQQNKTLAIMEAMASEPRHQYEVIDSKELAVRWNLPESWIREQVRSRSTDTLPHLRFGKYVRFRWGSPELEGWAERRIVSSSKR